MDENDIDRSDKMAKLWIESGGNVDAFDRCSDEIREAIKEYLEAMANSVNESSIKETNNGSKSR